MKLSKPNVRTTKIQLKETVHRYLQGDDVICKHCNGIGLLFEDIHLNPSDKNAPVRTEIQECPHCIQGVVKHCKHCKQPLSRFQTLCGCKKSIAFQRAHDNHLRESAANCATYISFSEARESQVFLFVPEYDEFVHIEEFENWVHMMREHDDDFSLLKTTVFGTKKEDVLAPVLDDIRSFAERLPQPINAYQPEERRALLQQLIQVIPQLNLEHYRYRYIPDYLTIVKVQQEKFGYTA